MDYMKMAVQLAKKAASLDEIPIGAIVVKNNVVVAKGHNNRHSKNDVLGHAEIVAIGKAQRKLKTWHLNDCEMYVTMKPCTLCERVIKESRISKVFYLVQKQESKREYNKTIIEKMKGYNSRDYKEVLSKFFVNKR